MNRSSGGIDDRVFYNHALVVHFNQTEWVGKGDPCGRLRGGVRGEAGGHKARPYQPIPSG
jgi:hypothetical protein